MKTTDKIRRFLAKGKTAAEIGKILKIDPNRVYTLKWLDKHKANPKKAKLFKSVKQASRVLKETKETKKDLVRIFNTDVVNHPPHYKAGGIETLDFIEAKDLNFRLGNVVKYVSRAGKKLDSDPLKDLEKAAFYLKREIDARKSA